MAAAAYYNEPRLNSEGEVLFHVFTEKDLDILAQDIDKRTVNFQARSRGFLARKRLFPRNADGDLDHDDQFLSRGSDPNKKDFGNDENEKSGAKSREIGIGDTDNNRKGETDSGDELDGGGDLTMSTETHSVSSYVPHDPESANRRVDDPKKWTVDWNSDGVPLFVDSQTEISTEVHPRQLEASLVPGNDLEFVAVWQRHLAQSISPLHTSENSAPTIGLLALKSAAKEWHEYRAPWWIERSCPQAEESLCCVCSHINFDALMHQTHPYMYHPKIPLGSLESISRKTSCSFCRLITHSAFVQLPTEIENAQTLKSVIYGRLAGDPEWNRYATRIRVLCVEFSVSLREGEHHVFGHGSIQQIHNGDEVPPEQKFNDCRFVRDQVDMSLIKSWLRTCEKDHGYTFMKPNFYPSFVPDKISNIHDPKAIIYQPCLPRPLNQNTLGITVIDVVNACLVDVTSDARYVALSYVWGGPQPFRNTRARETELREPHSISVSSKKIPKTIRDAIQVVAALGEVYLWVDSLCIVQDDMRKKATQIANMGNVYSQALLTIVAAYGDNADAGLPGVQSFSRKTVQHTEKVQGMTLANRLAYLEDTVTGSVWNSRGWTFQEGQLSKRCLFFSETQVYFRCNRATCMEDSGLRDVAFRAQGNYTIRTERHPIWNNYRRAVENFTKRSLTFEADIENAFQGMASLLQPAFKGDFLFGLPETELDVALLWQPNSLIRRRFDPETGNPIFPSWSWAGWVGEVKYKWTEHVVDDLSRVKWHATNACTGQDGFFTSDDLRAPRDKVQDVWESGITSERQSPYYYEHDNPDIWCLHPTAPKDQRLPLYLIHSGSHQLRFNAHSAFFRISTTHRPAQYDPVSSCDQNVHILCPIDVFDPDGFVAGTIYVPGRFLPTVQSPETKEFICLSRRRGHYLESDFDKVYKADQNHKSHPTPEDDFRDIPDRVTLYPEQRWLHHVDDKYDHRRYNKNKPWPLYNVMMIERVDGVAYRVAIGIIHVTAFIRAKPTWKLIVLA
jgi:Heterokaryon incompatibility protein (HET)